MNRIVICLLGFLFLPEVLVSQPFRGPGPRNPERIEQLRKVRLIESLDLSEEQSVRFFARLHEHEKARADLFDEKMDLLDKLDQMVVGEEDEEAMKAMFPRILSMADNEDALEKEFFNGLGDLLSPMQRAKFILFERQFQRELRDALREVQRRRPE